MNRFRLKACRKCGGDLALEEKDWRCLQCATYYYVGLYPTSNYLAPGWRSQLQQGDGLRPPFSRITGTGTA